MYAHLQINNQREQSNNKQQTINGTYNRMCTCMCMKHEILSSSRIGAIARHVEFEAIDVFELHTPTMVVCWMPALACARSLCLVPAALEARVKS